MFGKKLIALTCVVFAIGLFVGVLSFRNDFASFKLVPVESDIVQAYFKVYNVSQDSGIAYEKLVSYVIVLNVTNPSDKTVSLSSLDMTLAKSGSQNGSSFSLNGILRYLRDFSETNTDNFLYPHASRLLAFSQTGFMPQIGLDFLNQQHTVLFFAHVHCTPQNERGGGTAIIYKQLPLTVVGQDEFAFGTMFKPGSYFFFDDDSLGLSFSSGQIR